MAAIVTDQFRIINTNNFVESVSNSSNSYYVFLGLPNPSPGSVGYGRTDNWDEYPFNPLDSYDYLSHCRDTIVFGKKITNSNIRRVIRRIDWVKGQRYEIYRHDYSILNRTAITDKSRLYDANYYVINSDYKVYICIDNGSSGSNLTGNKSQDEPTFTDLEPSKAGESGDGYVWKYLFTISPSEIVKFDSIEYIVVPNNWDTSTDPQIVSVRENGDSSVNNNQIKKVYIKDGGRNYNSGEVNIVGDGVGGKVYIEADNFTGEIINTIVTSGGTGYTYGIVDLNPLQQTGTLTNPAKLIPIIPPSKGHGYDIYKELGTDKVLVYTRFDDSSKDFPTDTRFSQIGIIKNPTKFISTESFIENSFSGLYGLKFPQNSTITNIVPGTKITQQVSTGTASGYIASYDKETKVLKYFKDRSLYYNKGNNGFDQVDYVGITTLGNANVEFDPNGGVVITPGAVLGQIDSSFSGITTTIDNKIISLDCQFTNGISKPEINKKTGDIIYIDNRPLVERNPRQKEDIKIILEF